jgi:hypothetical protein
MGRDEFNYWNLNGWESLQKDLKEDKRFITIDLPGRKKFKNIRPYSTFILKGSDSWKALIEYLPQRSLAKEKFDHVQQISKRSTEKKGRKFVKETFNQNAIVYNNRGRPVSKVAEYVYWSRKCEQIGILERIGNSDCRNRYGVNPHEMRDLFRSQWEKTPAKASIGEYLMGHQIDPLEYNKAFRDVPWVISELNKAIPLLNIMSSNLPFGLYDKDDIEDIIKQESEKRVAEMFKLEKAKMKDQVDELVNLKLQEWAKKSKDLEDKANLLKDTDPLKS